MKSPLDYVQELKDLTVDLEDAITEKDGDRLAEIIEQCNSIIGDIEESFEEESSEDD